MFNIKSLFNKKNKQCWEVRNCKQEARDKCPAYLQEKTNECWLVDGTLCDGFTHDEFSRKLKDCTSCGYYITTAWGLEPTDEHKEFVKEAVRKAREKNARISIENILKDCLIRFKEAASVKNIKIEISVPQKLQEQSSKNGEFYGNKEELSHVFLHFLSKSLTYSKPETTLYLRADEVGDFIQVGIIYSSNLNGPLLYEEKEEKTTSGSNNPKEKRELLSEEIISNYAGTFWEEINPIGRSGIFFTLAKDRRAEKRKLAALATPSHKPNPTQDRRL